LTDQNPAKKTHGSGERDFEDVIFDLSLLKTTDSLLLRALMRLSRCSLVVKVFLRCELFVALSLTFARLLSNERTNE
jgi:hypothetical protein